MAVFRVAPVWFFFLGGVGMIFPFFPFYLQDHLGLGDTQVGLVVAMSPLVGMLSQPLWGHVADRTGRRVFVLSFLTVASAAGYAALGVPESFEGFLVVFALHAFFATSTIPSLWSVTMALLAERNLHSVGWVRGCGTLGFGASVAAFPWLVRAVADWDVLPSAIRSAPLRVMFPMASLLVLFAALASATLPRRGDVGRKAARGDARSLLEQPAFMRVLLVVFVAFFCMQGPTSLFPLLVRARGGGVEAVSEVWLLMLSLELPLVAAFGFTVRRLGVRAVMSIGIFSAAARWLLSGFVSDLTVLTAAQSLHGIAVWGVLLGGPAYVDAVVAPQLRSTAQALLATVGFGLGTVLSSSASGWLSEAVGAAAPAQFAGFGSLVLGALMLKILPEVPAYRDEGEAPAESFGAGRR